MLVGFIHGVMNTDNMSIAGETIDYGPCAFMDTYDPGTVFSSIDERGRYAYGNQPPIALWNLTRFAEALLPLLSDYQDRAIALAEEALGRFNGLLQDRLVSGFRQKLGLGAEAPDDVDLVKALLETMQRGKADFTLVFRRLSDEVVEVPQSRPAARELFADPAEFDDWQSRWRERLSQEALPADQRQRAMLRVNPLFIPRNHRVEAAIEAAVEEGDLAPFEELLAVLAKPFEEQPGRERYAMPPVAHERVMATFCGT